ncbi:MAG: HdeD family acid-resistance protein [Candidatus Promineifilaceae bacterium]|nr:HdeD family acid-resistance protein [Candidatus Promineifilaceae bacterium]
MTEVLSKYWWVLLVRGIVAVIFGIAALVWTEITLEVLILLVGAFLLVDGIFSLISAFGDRQRNRRWWVLLLEGVAGVVAGIAVFVWPALSGLVLLYLIAAWALVTGVFEVIAAVQLRREVQGEWVLIVSGILSIIFGVLIAIFPGEGALAVVWVIGIYAILFGVLLILLSFRARGMGRSSMT